VISGLPSSGQVRSLAHSRPLLCDCVILQSAENIIAVTASTVITCPYTVNSNNANNNNNNNNNKTTIYEVQ